MELFGILSNKYGEQGILMEFPLVHISFNSFPTSGDFCRLLITFANSLEPKSGLKKCLSGSGSKLFDTLMVLLKAFLENSNFVKNQQTTKA